MFISLVLGPLNSLFVVYGTYLPKRIYGAWLLFIIIGSYFLFLQEQIKDIIIIMFVLVCKYVLGRSRTTQPPNLRLCLLRHFGFLTSPHAIPTRSGCHHNSFRLLRRSTSAPHPIPRAHFLHLPTSPRLSLVPCFFFYGVESKESGHRLCRD